MCIAGEKKTETKWRHFFCFVRRVFVMNSPANQVSSKLTLALVACCSSQILGIVVFRYCHCSIFIRYLTGYLRRPFFSCRYTERLKSMSFGVYRQFEEISLSKSVYPWAVYCESPHSFIWGGGRGVIWGGLGDVALPLKEKEKMKERKEKKEKKKKRKKEGNYE